MEAKIKLNQLYSLFLAIFRKTSDAFRKITKEQIDIKVFDKGINDKFTEIDWIIQHIMECYIEKYFKGLTFVGEEDTTNIIEYGDKYKFLTEIDDVDLELIPSSAFDQNEFDFSDIKLFIDPIDATMDFIKKNYAVVTNLVGIVYKNEPLIGLVHYPFYDGEVNDKSVSYFNIPGKGIYEYHTYSNKMEKYVVEKKDKFTFSCSKSKVTEQIMKIFELFEGHETEPANGLGNKLIRCFLKDMIFISKGSGVGFWDICAGHALSKELGGGCFYLDGTPINYPMVVKEFVTQPFFVGPNEEKNKVFVQTLKDKNFKYE